MNERIRVLAEQARIKDHWSIDEGRYLTNYLNEKKFAELIVKECVRIARATPCPYEQEEVKQRLGHTWDMASLEAGRGISKHFGLEK